jgi:hypothetical protein
LRTGIGYVLIVLAVLGGALGLAFVAGAGGYEADAVRAAGFVYLGIAVVIGLAGILILASRR